MYFYDNHKEEFILYYKILLEIDERVPPPPKKKNHTKNPNKLLFVFKILRIQTIPSGVFFHHAGVILRLAGWYT